MRVVFISNSFLPNMGGIEIHIMQIAKRLINEGHIADVITLKKGRLPKFEIVEGISIHRISNLFGLYMKLIKFNYDILHAHSGRRPLSTLGIMIAKNMSIPSVFTPHCYYPARSIVNSFEQRIADKTFAKWSLKYTNKIICLTQEDLMDAQSIYKIDNKFIIIPNSIVYSNYLKSIDEINFKKIYNLKDYFVVIGRASVDKDYPSLLKAFAQIETNSKLVFIGQERNQTLLLKKLAEKLGIERKLKFLGRIPFSHLKAGIKKARCLCLSSRKEGLPTVALEAMILKTPVISSDSGGTKHLIQDMRNGFLFSYGNQESLCNKLKYVLEGRVSEDVIENAYRDVIEKYSWEVNFYKITNIYKELIEPS